MSSPRCRPTSRTSGALLVALALVAGGCGSHAKPTAAKPTATATAFAHPHIVSPANGDVIPATAELDTSRGAKVAVTGTAQPDTEVVVTTGCRLTGCSVTTKTDAQGRFSAGVSASTTSSTHAVTVTVAYEISDAVDSDRVIVTIGPQHGGSSATPRTPRRKHRGSHPAATPFPAITVAPPAATAAPQVTAAPTTSGTGTSGSVVVIGDSLAQGMQPYLPAALPGWKVSVDARIGRPLAEGMGIFAKTPVQAGTVYAFSLFTNDDPRSVAALDAAVRQSVQRGGCAVWATVVRPPVGGVSYDAANRDLRRLAASLGGRLQLVDWAAAVASHPQWVPGSDGVHSNAEGYRNRAALYAQAIRGCG